jgi:hypothetical protein
MKVDAKLAEQVPLMHKFPKQTRVSFFHNKRRDQLDLKLMFWGRFGPFHYCLKVDAKMAELAPLTYKFAKRSCVGTFRN